jgi:hypothetical protein
MKKIALSIAVVFAAFNMACSQTPQDPNAANKKVEIKFETLEHDFGTIEQGADGSFDFKFTNIGKEPLILSRAQASCGCTTPEWTQAPVAKKKAGTVKVKYNTNIVGAFSKNVTVYSNAKNGPIVLHIKGTVVPKQQPTTNDQTVK